MEGTTGGGLSLCPGRAGGHRRDLPRQLRHAERDRRHTNGSGPRILLSPVLPRYRQYFGVVGTRDLQASLRADRSRTQAHPLFCRQPHRGLVPQGQSIRETLSSTRGLALRLLSPTPHTHLSSGSMGLDVGSPHGFGAGHGRSGKERDNVTPKDIADNRRPPRDRHTFQARSDHHRGIPHSELSRSQEYE